MLGNDVDSISIDDLLRLLIFIDVIFILTSSSLALSCTISTLDVLWRVNNLSVRRVFSLCILLGLFFVCSLACQSEVFQILLFGLSVCDITTVA